MKKFFILAALIAGTLLGFTNVKINMNPMTSDTSLLTLDKVEALGGVEFIVTSNGKVGIANPSPYYVLTIGRSGFPSPGNAMLYGNGSWQTSSDRRFKENIRDLDNALDIVLKLHGVRYNFINDTTKQETIGFIADEVREILPSFVSEDNEGYLGLGYGRFAPVLAAAIQEQQAIIVTQQEQIDNQQKQIDELKGLLRSVVSQSPTPVNYAELPQAVLYQNNPNPWKETTEIRYELPEDATDAAIYISDLSGKLLKTLPATDSGVVTLKGSDLKAGIYAYSLVVDGVIIDTKKMLLTK
ncbi:MAG: tail fiber domain-containing protein [Dysgonamonadaceae bacterium]|jgi:hypothetical protein|nr:tail fiber domain-containing protein [Dysgonamonadaceae bacterium]